METLSAPACCQFQYLRTTYRPSPLFVVARYSRASRAARLRNILARWRRVLQEKICQAHLEGIRADACCTIGMQELEAKLC